MAVVWLGVVEGKPSEETAISDAASRRRLTPACAQTSGGRRRRSRRAARSGRSFFCWCL